MILFNEQLLSSYLRWLVWGRQYCFDVFKIRYHTFFFWQFDIAVSLKPNLVWKDELDSNWEFKETSVFFIRKRPNCLKGDVELTTSKWSKAGKLDMWWYSTLLFSQENEVGCEKKWVVAKGEFLNIVGGFHFTHTISGGWFLLARHILSLPFNCLSKLVEWRANKQTNEGDFRWS